MSAAEMDLHELRQRLVGTFESQVDDAIAAVLARAEPVDDDDQWTYRDAVGPRWYSAFSGGRDIRVWDNYVSRSSLVLPAHAMDSLAVWWLRYRAASEVAS